MAELKYVDWDGLVYYDGKVKDYIDDKFGDVLKVGGLIKFEDLPCPSFQNLNYLYKISNDFTSNEYFYKPGYVYEAGTVVQVSNLNNVYLYTIFQEVDNIKPDNPSVPENVEEIVEKVEELDAAISHNAHQIASLEQAQESQDARLDAVESIVEDTRTAVDTVVENQTKVNEALDQMRGSVDAIEDNLTAIDEKLDQIENNYQPVDLSAYYTKSETEAAIKSAVDSIEIPKVPTKVSELENDAGYLTEHQDLSDYAKKSEIPSVEGFASESYVDAKIAAINIPDTSVFVTNEEFTTIQQQVDNIQNTYITEELLEQKNYVTEQFVTNNYVTNETIEANYSTTEEIAQTYVSNNDVNEIVTNQVTEVINQKIEDGNLVVNPDAINYDTWD